MRGFAVQVFGLGVRSLIRTIRQPGAVVPALLFPLLFLALLNAGVRPAATIPGFPAPSYLDFILGGLIVQGVMFGGINSGTDLAVDVESGFLNRLAMTPMRRVALLLGHSAGMLAVGLVQATLILLAGVIGGAHIEAGAGGIAVLYLLTVFISLSFSNLSAVLALRSGSSEVVQSSFPLFFIILVFSSFFLPRPFLDADWFRTLADYNPASYMIEGVRSLIVDGWDLGALAQGFGWAIVMSLVGFTGAVLALRSRVARA